MEDHPKLPSHEASIPLIARLDHLEFIMKYLERKQRCGSNVNADKQSLDLAKKEAYFKGTLLDRVASLEHRLYQLCMEMDSSCNSSSLPLSRASTQASGESSSSQESKAEICYSFPTFNNLSNHADKVVPHFNSLDLQEKSEGIDQHPIENSSPPKQQVVKNKPNKKNEKKCKGAKKRNPTVSWPHLKLLGC